MARALRGPAGGRVVAGINVANCAGRVVFFVPGRYQAVEKLAVERLLGP